MSTPSKAVFLSYASQDGEAARRICDALRALHVEVWFDQSALRGGDAWDASIRRQIRECALFVPVISANTQAREEGYFRREWNLAVNRTLDMADGKAFLLPVVIDATIDVNARVPEKFRDVQWTHLPDGVSPNAFAEHVHRLLSGAPAPARSPRALPAAASRAAVREREPASVAVLPFVNMSRDEENEYFADGLAEELLNVLAKIRGLSVAARSSAFKFKGKAVDAADVGRALNVSALLEGSVRKAGNRLRIAVRLVKVSDGYQLWSETYDRTLDDIFAVQDDIAQSVVKELRATLLGESRHPATASEASAAVAAAVKGRSSHPEAHRHFLHARYFIDRNTREDTSRGIEYLKEALALESDFALAWAELGRAYANEANWGWAPAAEGYARARDAVLRAVALEPDLAEGHAGMAWIQMVHDWDWRAADASFRRALELAPGNALVLQQAGLLAANTGRFEEGIALGRRAVEQDPLSATAYFFLGLTFIMCARYGDAEVAMSKGLELAPQSAAMRAWLAIALHLQGRLTEAREQARREPEDWGRLFALGLVEHAAGRAAEADDALRQLIAKHCHDAAYQVAEVHAARGDTDAAFEWLERARTQHDAGVAWSQVDPLLRPLHEDTRWTDFLRKIRFVD
ncbi:MAG TPA: TIR domain-containing protein [Casimicrobiaceae bacterium]|nr:TIR domain-containing protein [Casimicrobiaceae bacterium]